MSHDVNKPFGLRAMSIFEITAPTVPTYATGLVIPCPISLELGREIVDDELEAADGICDYILHTKNITFTLEFGGQDLAVAAIALSETDPTDGGTTPNEYTYLDITNSMTVRTFGLIGQAANSAGGDTHVILFNCVAKEGPDLAFAQNERANSEFSGSGRVRQGGTQFIRVLNHETLTAVPSAWPGVTAY